MPAAVTFEILARDGTARRGRLETPHGVVDTPAFMPVATYGAVRGVAPSELRAIGAQILLSNTYHLHERPGEDVVRDLGGLHGFSGWDGPWLTDSGGYQVTSLAAHLHVDEEGVSFTSTLDGRRRLLTPETAIAIQGALGSDVAMVLDECRPPAAAGGDSLRDRHAMERTLRWSERALGSHRCSGQALFGIVQGARSLALRRESARRTAALGFDGYAHGGLGLGEEPAQRLDLVAEAQSELPATAPRYLMGLGRPVDLVDGVAAGVDLFDCVIPTRHGRHGVLFTGEGLLRIRAARFQRDAAPPDPACDCPVCARFSRAYLRHLLRSGEALGARLASLHNLRFYHRLLEEIRSAIAGGTFEALRRRVAEVGERDAA